VEKQPNEEVVCREACCGTVLGREPDLYWLEYLLRPPTRLGFGRFYIRFGLVDMAWLGRRLKTKVGLRDA